MGGVRGLGEDEGKEWSGRVMREDGVGRLSEGVDGALTMERQLKQKG